MATAFAIAVGCGAANRSPSPPVPAAQREATPAPAAPEPPLSDEAPEPTVSGSGAAPGDDQAARRRQPQGARHLGAQGLRRCAAGDPPTRGSGPLDLLFVAPGYLPLHTRAFTDHDETLSVRLYDEEAASSLLGHPIK